MSTPRVRLPRSAAPGETIEVRALLDHPMIAGVSGPNPRNMLARFEVSLNGEALIGYDFGNGAAANPTVFFHARAEAPGEFLFTWTHEDGTVVTHAQTVTVG